MIKKNFSFLIFGFYLISIIGCAPLLIGGAVGALGGYAISKDTIQAETQTDYDKLWNASLTLIRYRGSPKIEDYARGYIQAEVESSKVWIRVIRLTKNTNRIRISSRKYHLPNLNLAQDLFVRIMEEAKK
ncbi:MAG: DUF3568 domain-containing protein [Candidatus Omnitrophica bacterium]|nr:DUF3568 domain-containing protein [Candidatus Omnitrophota bacterium]